MQVSVSLKYYVEQQKQKQMDVSGCISGINIKFTKIKEKIEIRIHWYNKGIFNQWNSLLTL